jgi:hypothetical protein
MDLMHLLEDVGLLFGGQARQFRQDRAQLVQYIGKVGGHRAAFRHGLKVNVGEGNDQVLDGQPLGKTRPHHEQDPLVEGIVDGLGLVADIGMGADDTVHVRPVPADFQQIPVFFRRKKELPAFNRHSLSNL